MTDAPEKIWVGSDICHDGFGPEPSIWKDEASSYETDIEYTRSDIAQVRIAKLEAVEAAAADLIADVRTRYPNEKLRCKYMIALDAALETKL
jgi:hypothetical protein